MKKNNYAIKKICIFSLCFFVVSNVKSSDKATLNSQLITTLQNEKISEAQKLSDCKPLLALKASPDATDKLGYTALIYASENSFLCTQLLVESRANINGKGKNGLHALHAIRGESSAKIMQYLIDNRADINTQTNDGETPLHYAVQNRNVPAVTTLLENKAKLDIVGECLLIDQGKSWKYKLTPYELACKQCERFSDNHPVTEKNAQIVWELFEATEASEKKEDTGSVNATTSPTPVSPVQKKTVNKKKKKKK